MDIGLFRRILNPSPEQIVVSRRFRHFGDYNVVAKAILALRHQVDFGRFSSIVGVNQTEYRR